MVSVLASSEPCDQYYTVTISQLSCLLLLSLTSGGILLNAVIENLQFEKNCSITSFLSQQSFLKSVLLRNCSVVNAYIQIHVESQYKKAELIALLLAGPPI